ncbi:ATP-dependent DNA helicase 2 subunit 1 [Halictus rubicundus]|uniref:ATP-dependent DNA helicase 2 subunit 1 n=1 Tax=Halictus rubicundus TaxID=77578 RepID=UPI004035E69D
MSYISKDFDDEASEDSEDPAELYGIRDGIIFIIDATAPMFVKDSNEDAPYFVQCIRQYKEILMQKLVWNRQDRMGLILFGTKQGDTDSEMKNILTLQKLSVASKDMLNQVIKIDEGQKWEEYRDPAFASPYPLHDVLWHAARMFSSINVTMPIRRVILFTCQDNPPITNDDEKRRIVVKAKGYSDIGLELTVVGLGKNWNHDVFYKDLEISSKKVDREDYRRTSLNDLLQQIKLPSRTMANLPWRLGGNVIIDVSIRNLSVKRAFLKKTCISKETNIPLTSHRYLTTKSSNNEDDENEEGTSEPVLETEIQKYQEFGNRRIYFTPTELQRLGNFYEPGIDLICVKPISYHPLYNFGAPHFVIPRKSNRKDNTLLFGALVEKCHSRNLMIICAVTMRKRSSPILYSMIPKTEKGGFYLYKIPYKEYVRNLDGICSKYKYNNDENKKPTEPHEVELFEKIIKKLRIQYDSSVFSNPKLQAQLQMVETLALDLEKSEPPYDDTIPAFDHMRSLVSHLLIKYKNLFGCDIASTSDGPPKKKSKKEKEVVEQAMLENEKSIRKLVKEGKIENLTLAELKTLLKTLGLKTSGKKNELIVKIKQYCS